MTCREAQDRDLAEQYCLKRLSAEEAADYEDHYFACEACYAELRAVQELKTHLAAKPVAVMPPPKRKVPWMAVAAGLAVAIGAPVWYALRPPAVDPYMELARVDPPAYTATIVRGTGSGEAFAAAMASYQAGRYAESLAALDALAKTEPDNVAAPYYAAACELALGHPAEAARRFGEMSAKGESRFQESAYWYEAKAWISVRNKVAAQQALGKMVALNGSRSADGKALLERLRPLR